MIDATELIAALDAYRLRLKEQGKTAKADAVEYCISIIRRLAK